MKELDCRNRDRQELRVTVSLPFTHEPGMLQRT